jgi:hypothetical protein
MFRRAGGLEKAIRGLLKPGTFYADMSLMYVRAFKRSCSVG